MKTLLLNLALLVSFSTVYSQSFCSKARTIQCGEVINSSNFESGNTLNVSSYGSCVSGINTAVNNFNGNDVVYRVDALNNSSITVTLNGLSSDLDVFIFKSCSSGASCIAKSTNGNSSSEIVNISNASGTYYIVIDGYNTSQRSTFNLTVKCAGDTGGGIGDGFNCSSAEEISCGRTYYHNNFSSGNRMEYENYETCVSGVNRSLNPFNGNDRLYKINVSWAMHSTFL
ncbi:MAG: hypothetical protein HC892_11745 [Saprospiraceae bacterium]|nr:hypothetical protein [Saprospiraceae bacterium]